MTECDKVDECLVVVELGKESVNVFINEGWMCSRRWMRKDEDGCLSG